MKKFCSFVVLFTFLSAFSSSFDTVRGGDIVEIYLNGNRVHQQFIHADKSAKAFQLLSLNNNDRLEVYYSHCGSTGKDRVLTIRNERNELLKELTFANSGGERSRMRFTSKDIGKLQNQKMNLYYSSKELPKGRLVAVIGWNASQGLAKR
jgi:hypothetical protein